MSISVPLQNNAIDVADLEKLAKSYPQYTKLFLGITQLDAFVKEVCRDVICNATDPEVYYIKTELTSTSYLLYLFNSERNATVGTLWPITTFLEECQSKLIELDVRQRSNTMLNTFGEIDLKTGTEVNWV